MLNFDLVERNKNLIVNIGIVVIALFIAWHLHNSANSQINNLVQQQESELEKNKVAQDIAALEQKSEKYKNTFVKKDLAEIMDILTGITKNTQVRILSVKPVAEEATENYRISSFLITLKATNFHALAEFISRVESYKDIYLINEVGISSTAVQPSGPGDNTDLAVTLKINTVYY